ncbi:MarR family transcriptional regulator [Terriglobus tenax]|uniref:MarR family transcriptional regulator n=1 Tax=Terriglobus tenax TaxID=1111115 RepID=UPI0021DF5DC6|nr:MarR family transcriptional regulator [Terriglobus tenax]
MLKIDLNRVELLAEFRYVLRSFLSFSEEAAEQEGIRAQQYQLMQVVAAAREPATIAYVAERMFLKHNSAVELVGRAVEEELLLRKRDLLDARKVVLKLTPRGERVLARLVERHLTELERVGPGVRQALEKVLTK